MPALARVARRSAGKRLRRQRIWCGAQNRRDTVLHHFF
jgi:hypothetical protein